MTTAPALPSRRTPFGRPGLREPSPSQVLAVALLLLLATSHLAITDQFFSRASLSTLTPFLGIVAIVAIGQGLVIGTGGVDLSAPAVIALMGSLLLKESAGQNAGLVHSLVVCGLACLVTGLVNGWLIEVMHLNSLVVTLVTGQLIAGATRLYRGDVFNVTRVPPRLSEAAGAGVAGISYLLVAALIFAISLAVFMRRTVPGRRLVASSANSRTATLAGLRASRFRVGAYVLATLTFGAAGVLAAGQVGTPDLTLGDPYLLAGIVAVVLGGASLAGGSVSPIATLLAAVWIAVLDFNLQVSGVSTGTRYVVQGLVLLLGLALVFLAREGSRKRSAGRERHDNTKGSV